MPQALVIDHGGVRLTIASRPPLLVTIYADAPTLDDIEVLDRHQRIANARAQGRCLNLAWIRPSVVATLPSEELRARTRRMLAELGRDVAANAQIVDAAGFTGATVRMLLTSLGVLTRPPHPTQVFAQIEHGIEWLARRPEAPAGLLDEVALLAGGIRLLAP